MLIEREMCHSCWAKRNKFIFLEESTDLYIYGDYPTIIRRLLIWKGRDDLIKCFNVLCNGGDKALLRKMYLRLRGLNERKQVRKRKKKKRAKKWPDQVYFDKCPYCIEIIKFDRNRIEGFTCPNCEKYLMRTSHDVSEESIRFRWDHHPDILEKILIKNGWK